MIRIAAWGYGIYGRRMTAAVDSYWKDEIGITRIYDRRYSELKGEDPRLADPAGIAEDYRNGLFSSVLISVGTDSGEIQDRLKECGIPVFRLTRPELYHPAADFEREENPEIAVKQPGYEYSVFRNLCGTVSMAPSSGIMYLFDEAGRALEDHWDSRRTAAYLTHQYDIPLRIDRPLPAVERMPGDWCILAKLWSPNYWHFTFEGMDCVQLLEEAGFTGTYVINNAPYNRELMLLYGIGGNRIRTLNDFELGKAYSFERVFYPRLVRYDRRFSAPVLERLAERMRAKLTLDREHYPARLFVERTGTRKLLNSRTFTEPYGFTAIDPDRYSVREQLQFFFNADIVLTPHGANSANSLYMRPGTVFIETFSSKWVQYCCIDVLHRRGVFYLPVVQGPVRPHAGCAMDMFEDYSMPEINLVSAIDTAVFLQSAAEEERRGADARE